VSTVGRWVPLVAIVTLLGAAMLSAVFANPTIERVPQGPPASQAGPSGQPAIFTPLVIQPTTAAPREQQYTIPGWVSWAVTALCGLVVVLAGMMLLWLVLRDRLVERRARTFTELSVPPTLAEQQQHLQAAIDEGIADLDDADADPRRAVIACWVRLERAAAAAGTPRQPGDTSTDLVARLLAAHNVSASVLDRFAALYRTARFAPAAVEASMRDQARSALQYLRRELSVGVN
jgi:Domain of unknown function (DUF4129)